MSEIATIPEKIQQDVVDVHDAIERYLSEGIPEGEFKPFRVARGIYGQRQKNVNMLRVKIPCGRITASQLRCWPKSQMNTLRVKPTLRRGRIFSSITYRQRA
jgi:sulfite reductase beta subunit-like hemoprotein